MIGIGVAVAKETYPPRVGRGGDGKESFPTLCVQCMRTTSRMSSQSCLRTTGVVASFRPEWTSTFGSERLTGALFDRLTHHVHILEMNGESYRLATSKKSRPISTTSPYCSKDTNRVSEAEPLFRRALAI